MMLRSIAKNVFLFVAALMVISAPLMAAEKVYVIPDELKQEIFANKQTLELNPESATANFELAMSYAYSGLIEKGWATLKVIPDYDPDFAPKVVKKYTQKIEEEPQEWRHHFKLAFGYYFQKNKEAAIDEFKKGLELDPDNVWIMGFIALVYGDLGKTDDALAYCKKALKIEPNATAIHFLIAEAYRRKGDYWKAVKHVAKVGRLKTAELSSPHYKGL